MGYDPERVHTGHAPLEAAGRSISVGLDALVFRCNLVTVDDGAMHDATGGHVSNAEAKRLIDDLDASLGELGARFHAGLAHRNLMVLSNALDMEVRCTPAYAFPAGPVRDHLPKGRGADRLIAIMDRGRAILAEHEVNTVRRDLGEDPVSDIWLWGQGGPTRLDPFRERFGVGATVVAAVDLLRGIARLADLRFVETPGATGDRHTDYAAKGRSAVEALDETDLVVVHVEAPQGAALQGDVEGKISAIEQIDEHVVGPIREALARFDRWRILFTSDLPTPVERRTLTATPPPFCMAGQAVHTVLARPFSERTAEKSDLQIDPGHELMEYFLRA
jgi:2,3-bisphosphoglycerate-independent phosphoglycerate mutase